MKFKNYLNEEKNSSYDNALKTAKKYKIKYKSVKNRWNGLEEIIYYDSLKDYYNQFKKIWKRDPVLVYPFNNKNYDGKGEKSVEFWIKTPKKGITSNITYYINYKG